MKIIIIIKTWTYTHTHDIKYYVPTAGRVPRLNEKREKYIALYYTYDGIYEKQTRGSARVYTLTV